MNLEYFEVFFRFSSVQSLSRFWLFATPWTAACQVSLSITNFRSPPKLMSIESVMPSNHLILCRPLVLLLPIPPSIRVFSKESALRSRWPKYWSFSFNISPSNEYSGLIFGWTDWISLQSKGLSRVFSNTTVQKHQFFSTQLSSQSNSHIQSGETQFQKEEISVKQETEGSHACLLPTLSLLSSLYSHVKCETLTITETI